MEKIYRQVSIKDRLPEKEQYYHTNQGTVYFDADEKRFRVPFDTTYTITYWLEEVELPSDEEIDKATVQYDTFNHSDTISEAFENGAKWALNTLKGEKR